MFSPLRLHRLRRDLVSALGASQTRLVLPRASRRALGAYFTPPPLADFVVSETIATYLAATPTVWDRDGAPRLVVLDPAAGDGRFLVAAVDYLTECARRRGFAPPLARATITSRCVVGIERDRALAAQARRALGSGARVYCREALLDAPTGLKAEIVVGNPPYQRSIRMAQNDASLWQALKHRYEATSHGEWDLYAAFLEQALEWVRGDGEVGLVVPSRWFTAAFAKRLRAKLVGAGAVRAVVDFGAEQIFAGATTYASVVFLSRRRRRIIRVARLAGRNWHCGDMPAAELGAAPWRLATGGRRHLLDRLSRSGPGLGEVARIAKGAGTNADPVYVLTVEPPAQGQTSGAPGTVRVASKALGEQLVLERDLLRLCLRGRDVKSYGAACDKIRVLVPYDRHGQLLSPAQLRLYPRTLRYLRRCRDLLEAREGGRFRGATYYRFGRPQNLAYLGDPSPKVVVPDVARSGRAALDARGAMVLDSAYAIRLQSRGGPYCLEVILAILNSPVVALWLGETGILLRGNYIRMKTAYLSSLPLPPPSPALAEIARAVGRGDTARASALLRGAYGLGRTEWSMPA